MIRILSNYSDFIRTFFLYDLFMCALPKFSHCTDNMWTITYSSYTCSGERVIESFVWRLVCIDFVVYKSELFGVLYELLARDKWLVQKFDYFLVSDNRHSYRSNLLGVVGLCWSWIVISAGCNCLSYPLCSSYGCIAMCICACLL